MLIIVWYHLRRSLRDSYICSSITIIKIRKRIGLRTEPCGTPERIGVGLKNILSILTICSLRLGKEEIQEKIHSVILSRFNST